MSTLTYGEIIEAARARSQFNDPSLYTPPELIAVINRYMRKLYGEIAEADPRAMATSAVVAPSGGEWAMPEDAEAVYRIEGAGGVEVNVAPDWDRRGNLPPRVYLVGRSYRSVGETGDPTTDSLTMFYAKTHPNRSATSEALDASFPAIADDLPILRVTRYLLLKQGIDQHAAEIQALDAEAADLSAALLLHLKHRNRAMRARFGDSPS